MRLPSSSLASTPASNLGLILVAEFTFIAWLRGFSVRDYLAGRDPVAGTVYNVFSRNGQWSVDTVPDSSKAPYRYATDNSL